MDSPFELYEHTLRSFINKHERFLFPKSPIEVVVESGKYAIYLEGAWYHDCDSIRLVGPIVRNALKLYIDDWLHPSTRVNPDWVGWLQLSYLGMVAIQNELSDASERKAQRLPLRRPAVV